MFLKTFSLKSKPSSEEIMIKNSLYSNECICCKEYKGKDQLPQKVRLDIQEETVGRRKNADIRYA